MLQYTKAELRINTASFKKDVMDLHMWKAL